MCTPLNSTSTISPRCTTGLLSSSLVCHSHLTSSLAYKPSVVTDSYATRARPATRLRGRRRRRERALVATVPCLSPGAQHDSTNAPHQRGGGGGGGGGALSKPALQSFPARLPHQRDPWGVAVFVSDNGAVCHVLRVRADSVYLSVGGFCALLQNGRVCSTNSALRGLPGVHKPLL